MQQLADRIASGDRTALSRGITLVESTLAADAVRADELLNLVWNRARQQTIRLAVTGPPGAGKSTLIEALGSALIDRGRRVAVLAVDPSSHRTGGSIMGDKTRMRTLSANPAAFIRPSPTGGNLGGVTRATREAITLCEAATYDFVIVETVGVGQSEIAAAEMVDYVLLVLLAGAGDDIQGIKRGILEVADLFTVNKADLDLEAARQARATYRNAAALIPGRFDKWRPPVTLTSATEGTGIDEVLAAIEELDELVEASGEKAVNRSDQLRRWFDVALRNLLLSRLIASPDLQRGLDRAKADAANGRACPSHLARALLASHP